MIVMFFTRNETCRFWVGYFSRIKYLQVFLDIFKYPTQDRYVFIKNETCQSWVGYFSKINYFQLCLNIRPRITMFFIRNETCRSWVGYFPNIMYFLIFLNIRPRIAMCSIRNETYRFWVGYFFKNQIFSSIFKYFQISNPGSLCFLLEMKHADPGLDIYINIYFQVFLNIRPERNMLILGQIFFKNQTFSIFKYF